VALGVREEPTGPDRNRRTGWQLELKVEFLDAYKTKPPNDLVKKNDVAFLTAVVFKF
jgi:hypothetical protein